MLRLDVVEDVHDGVVEGDVHDRLAGEDAVHRPAEDLPLLGSPEVVGHEEAATQEVLAEDADFRLSLKSQYPVWVA